MRQHNTLALYIAFLVAFATPSAIAESVAVKGNSIFILDNSVSGSQIVVRNFTDGRLNACLATTGTNLLGLSDDTQATDIVIKNGTAIVTTHNSTNLVTDVKLVDVRSCPIAYRVDLRECYAKLDDDKLTIPCLKYGTDIISVALKQRGRSMNFEFESYKPNRGRDFDDDDYDD